MVEYANRINELSFIQEALKENTEAIFIMAGKAYGITSFLKDKLISDLCPQNTYSFYVNANNGTNLSSALLDLIIRDSELYEIMQDCFNKNYGEKSNSLLYSITQDIPYIGNSISHLVEKETALPLYTGNFASAMEEVLTIFFKEISNKKILIIVDTAQNIFEDSYAVVNDLIKFNNIQFIFAITEYNDNYRKLKNFINLKEFTTKEITFCAPHASLIIEIGKVFNRKIEYSQAENMISSTSGNIHKIVESITNPNFEHNFSLWSKAIVSILYICQFPLSKEDLFGILKFCHLYSSNPMDTFEKSTTDLFTMAIISKTDTYYELQSINHPDVYVLVNSYTDQIVYKRNVLAYYKTKKQHSKKLAELLYSLSDELKDTDCKKYARILIKHSLQDGSKITENLIDSADFNANSFQDSILCSIIYARKREYSNALKWLEKIDTDANLYIKAFWGILLNRTRNHNKAETVLYQVLGKIENLDIKAIGYSFLISNHIHKEELNKAQELYFIAKDCCKGSKNLGYLIRNAISAFEDHSLDMYNEALEHFLLTNDMFGYYSTLCNKGYSILSTETEQGKKDLIESYQNLNLYGENISHIVCNDLGIAYLLKNDYENAKYFFDKVIANEDNSMPKIFAKINLACCDALAGNIQLAIKSIFDLQEEVENSPLDRIRQKYYINRLLIEYLANMPVDKQIMEKAKEYPDRYNPEKTISAIEFYEKHPLLKSGNHLENWLPLYSPCGLVYWYINPLKIFPESIADEIISI